MRRVVWNKQTIFFARAGEIVVFDSIPLAEVTSVQQVDEPEHNGLASPSFVALPNVVSGGKKLLQSTLRKSGK